MLASVQGLHIFSEAGGRAFTVEHVMTATQHMINVAWRGVRSIQQRGTLSLNLMKMNPNSSVSLGHKTQIKLSGKWTVHI